MKPNPVERKVRKELRLKKPLKKGDKVLVVGDLCAHLLKAITNLPLVAVKMPSSGIKMDEGVFSNKKIKDFVKKNKINKVVLAWTMDDEVAYFLNCVFDCKKPKFLGHYGKFVKLLIAVDKEDAVNYAKKRKIKFDISKKDELEKFVSNMNKRYKETKYSLLATTREFSKQEARWKAYVI